MDSMSGIHQTLMRGGENIKQRIKKIVNLSILLSFFWMIVPSFAAEKVIIAAIKSYDISLYSTVLEGFKEALKEKEIDFSLIQYDIKKSKEEGRKAIEEIKTRRPDLILTLGSLATEIAKEDVKDIPIVFSVVLNPVDSGFVNSMQSSGNNLTGASLDISIEKQFENLKAIVPNVRKIGVLYNPTETGEVIKKALIISKEIGLKLIAKPISSEKDVPDALRALTKGIDCLWAVADSTVFSSLQSTQFIILYTLRNQIPFMGISPSYVKAGALFALFCDYEDIGRQSGELAAEILAGEKPTELPITIPRKIFLSLNLRVAEQIGLRISSDIVNKAKEVFR